ncbi:MAG: phosphopantetheine-binding protein [Polyangiaceae bacterium]
MSTSQSTKTVQELKELIVRELKLDGKDPASIEDEGMLFGEGLGLDSLDALQLAMSIEEHFGVRIPEGEEARPIFRCVASLAAHIDSARAEMAGAAKV